MRDKQTPLNSSGDEAKGCAGGSGRALFRRTFAQLKWKRVIKAALLRAGRAVSPPPCRQQPGPAPALLPGYKCRATQFISVGLLCLTSVEQREEPGPGIGLNEGNLYAFILQAERGSGPLLLPALFLALALTTEESRTWPRAGNF